MFLSLPGSSSAKECNSEFSGTCIQEGINLGLPGWGCVGVGFVTQVVRVPLAVWIGTVSWRLNVWATRIGDTDSYGP